MNFGLPEEDGTSAGRGTESEIKLLRKGIGSMKFEELGVEFPLGGRSRVTFQFGVCGGVEDVLYLLFVLCFVHDDRGVAFVCLNDMDGCVAL